MITSGSISSVVSNDIVELMEVKSEVLSNSFEAHGSEEMIIEEFALDDQEGKEEFATDDCQHCLIVSSFFPKMTIYLIYCGGSKNVH